MNTLEAIRIRKSIRTYDPSPLEPSTVSEMVDFFDRSDRLNSLALKLVPAPAKQVEEAMHGLVGSYGKLKGAPLWMIGLSVHGEYSQENFGFALEQFVIEAARKELGTCWIGGFFKESKIMETVKIPEGHRIICITPLGHPAKPSFSDSSMRLFGGLNKRKPIEERFFLDRWCTPATKLLEKNQELAKLCEYTRWAPSASNKQPVHYVFDDQGITAILLTSLQRNWPGFIKKDHVEGLNFQGVDAGIGMAHIHVAAREMGMPGKWTLDFDRQETARRLALPADTRVVGLFQFDSRPY